MPKPHPTAALAARLVRELAACQTAGDHYPIRLSDLAARLDPAAEPSAALKAADTKAFKEKAIVAIKGRMDSPAALSEDVSRLASSPSTLEAALRAAGEKGSPPWPPKKVASALQKAVQPAFQEHLDRQLASGELPTFAVRVAKGKAFQLHHRDQPPPPPPEVQDAERLLDLLRQWAGPGGPAALVLATELERAAGLKPAAFKKAVKQAAFTRAVTRVGVKPNDEFFLLGADEFGRFLTGALLIRLLDGCSRANAHAFAVKELVGLLKDKAQQQIATGLLSRPDLARDLPSGIGCVLLSDGKSGGQNAFFRLEHLRSAQSPVQPGAAVAPAPAPPPTDFTTAFDAVFARLDRERGSNNFVSLVDLRAALPGVPREAFDANLHELRRNRRYVLNSAEHSGSITPEQQAAAIREEGEFLLHVSRSRQ